MVSLCSLDPTPARRAETGIWGAPAENVRGGDVDASLAVGYSVMWNAAARRRGRVSERLTMILEKF